MSEPVLCKLCGKRRARRNCPAVDGDICAICCGTYREVTLTCPLSCEYLQQAHRYEKPLPVAEGQLPNPDISVTEEFIGSHEEIVVLFAQFLLEATLRTSSAVDSDVISGLEALIQTHRTLEAGLVYETRPENSIAAAIQKSFTASLAESQKMRTEREGLFEIRNNEILTILVFLHRIALQNQNGRPRGRMYLDLLWQMAPRPDGIREPAPSILL